MSWGSGGSDCMFVLGLEGSEKKSATPEDNFWNSPYGLHLLCCAHPSSVYAIQTWHFSRVTLVNTRGIYSKSWNAPCPKVWSWDGIGLAVRADFRRLYPANAKTPTCCPSDDQGDKLCDVSTVPLVARWPVFLARGSDADGEPHWRPRKHLPQCFQSNIQEHTVIQ